MATLLSDVRDQANAALAAGDHGRALALVETMRRHFPRDYQSLQLLGRIHLEAQEFQDAREAFQSVLNVDPEDTLSRSALAVISEIEGNPDGALEQFERAYEVDPSNHEIASDIERLHTALNHSRRAESGSNVHVTARRFLLERKYERAIPWFQEALKLKPESPEIAVGLARAFLLAMRPGEALEVARDVLARSPNCLCALVVVAAAIHSTSGVDSKQWLDRTAELNPGNAVARALFTEAGLSFPDRTEKLEIQDEEIGGPVPEEAGQVRVPADLEVAGSESGGGLEAVEDAEPTAHSEDASASEDEYGAEAVEPEVDAESPEPEAAAEIANLLESQPSYDPGEAAPVEIPVTDSENGPGDEPPTAAAPGGGMIGAHEVAGLVNPSTGLDQRQSQVQADDAGPMPRQRAAEHMAAAAAFAGKGLINRAVAEYAVALKMDPSLAPVVGRAALGLANARPNSIRARWLAGDALAVEGQFSRAVEQYLVVLKRD